MQKLIALIKSKLTKDNIIDTAQKCAVVIDDAIDKSDDFKINIKIDRQVIDWIFQYCVALIPVLYLLNFHLLNISLGTVLWIVFLPYSAMYIWNHLRRDGYDYNKLVPFFPFALLFLYLVIRSDWNLTFIVMSIATLVHFGGVLSGSVDFEKIKKIIIYFALINAGLVIVQTFFNYVFDIQLQYIPKAMIHDAFSNRYVFRDTSGLYRPSALFLEPANYIQYCAFALMAILFGDKKERNMQHAVVIAIGCILTTSGMGMATVFAVFLWYFIVNYLKNGKIKKFSAKQIVIGVLVVIVAAVIFCQIPFINTALKRVFSTVDGYNAIEGRVAWWKWEDVLTPSNPLVLLFGNGHNAEYEYYLSGFADIIFKYGIIGLLIELSCFAYMMYKKRTDFVWCTMLAYCALLVIAHLVSFFELFFYFALVISYTVQKEKVPVDRRELTDDELKKTAYDILVNVADFCDKNDIRYYLACGTALGAIRHDGFIPWDDDVDIAMPREDYERFMQLYSSEQYSVCESRINKKYPYPFGKVCDNSTIVIEHVDTPCEFGVYIDIFPIDGTPDNEEERAKHLKRLNWEMRLLAWKRISHEKKVGIVHKVIQVVAKALLFVIPVRVLVRRIEKTVAKYPYASSDYVGHFITKAYSGTDIKPKAMFENPVAHKFEDSEFFVPGDVDAYLTSEYGDYMQLPPEEKRVATHDSIAYYR